MPPIKNNSTFIEKHLLDFYDTESFSPIFKDYIGQFNNLRKFYHYAPDEEGVLEAVQSKNFSGEKRKKLVNVLKSQYQSIKLKAKVDENIEALNKPNTFTITTGHQLCLFTGPLYFIYKIISTINLASKLNNIYPDYYFVPVYWMASEDHDVEEVNHFRIFDENYQWQTSQNGPVGRFSTSGISEILDFFDKDQIALFRNAYLNHNNLANAMRYLVDELFGDKGLIVLDPDNDTLKNEFKSVIKDDILNQNSAEKATQAYNELKNQGYNGQVEPRDINFFYLQDHLRERIVKNKENNFKVLNTGITFSPAELEQEINNKPSSFSPNVLTRPLYQEWVLPDVAYIGGPAEIAYWLELQPVFDHYKCKMPVVIPRNFALIINKRSDEIINKLNIDYKEIFKPADSLKKIVLERNAQFDIKLQDEEAQIKEAFEEIKTKGKNLELPLENYVEAREKYIEKILENIRQKFRKHLTYKEKKVVEQVYNLKNELFPDGTLQERKINFLQFYLKDKNFIEHLYEKFDPLDFHYNIFIHHQ